MKTYTVTIEEVVEREVTISEADMERISGMDRHELRSHSPLHLGTVVRLSDEFDDLLDRAGEVDSGIRQITCYGNH